MRRDRIDHLFTTIDTKDAAGFAAFLAEDGCLRFGSAPVVRGRGAIEQMIGGFFDTLDGLSHTLGAAWDEGDTVICEGEVTYRRSSGELTLPFLNVLRFTGDLIHDYRIYIDPSPLADL